MIKGGYANIDLKGVPITTTGVKIEGVYEQCENSNGKMVVVNDLNLSDETSTITAGALTLQKIMTDDEAMFTMIVFVVTGGIKAYFIEITNDDTVKYEILNVTTTEA